jgi:tripartite-type tricarboxylate transporter receptor subunit TctC
MNLFKRKTTTLLGATILSMLTISTGWAQDDYPSRPIRLVVPYAAGGGTDILARQLTKKVGELLGQPIVVDNKPGAGTAIGAAEVAKASPDGYTLLWGDNATFALNPHVYKKLAYDPLTSFAPVTLTVRGALVLLTADRLGVKNVNDLIALSKNQAGKLPGQWHAASLGDGGIQAACGQPPDPARALPWRSASDTGPHRRQPGPDVCWRTGGQATDRERPRSGTRRFGQQAQHGHARRAHRE